MAVIKNISYKQEKISPRTFVEADYSFNENYFQIKTYKEGDLKKESGAKQNLQMDKQMAQKLLYLLKEFLNQ